MQTPSKEPESSSMTHEEEEDMLHDISKLQEQVQQMSHSQKLTEAKIKGMEAKMDDSKIELKRDMADLKIDLKTNMDELNINMNKLLEEMGTKGERVLKETHDENKINVNHDSIDAN